MLEPGAFRDWDVMAELVAAETPFWEPGTRHGYHGHTFGWLVSPSATPSTVIALRPSLMLLDEPTTGLDVAEVEQLAQSLERLKADGATLLIVAHDVRFVMGLCDHVYVPAGGRLLSEGSPAEVQRDAAVIEAYLGHPL
jgi:ABC-type cobalamin transport system ATPase subunit